MREKTIDPVLLEDPKSFLTQLFYNQPVYIDGPCYLMVKEQPSRHSVKLLFICNRTTTVDKFVLDKDGNK